MSEPELCEAFVEAFGGTESSLLHDLTRETALTQINPRMISGNYQGRLLAMIIKIANVRRALEIGTFAGYSAICMAQALPCDGLLTTIEINDEIEWLYRKYFARAGVEHKIEAIVGDALTVVPTLHTTFDLAFIDGDKRQYIDYIEAVLPVVKPNGIILIDNVLWSGKIFRPIDSGDYMTQGITDFNNHVAADSRVEKIILPLRDGLMLLRKK